MSQIPESRDNVEGNGVVLHVLSYQVADVFARRGIRVFVARTLIRRASVSCTLRLLLKVRSSWEFQFALVGHAGNRCQ